MTLSEIAFQPQQLDLMNLTLVFDYFILLVSWFPLGILEINGIIRISSSTNTRKEYFILGLIRIKLNFITQAQPDYSLPTSRIINQRHLRNLSFPSPACDSLNLSRLLGLLYFFSAEFNRVNLDFPVIGLTSSSISEIHG